MARETVIEDPIRLNWVRFYMKKLKSFTFATTTESTEKQALTYSEGLGIYLKQTKAAKFAFYS
jgi:hypothetical protein